jgi:hypothetical protein
MRILTKPHTNLSEKTLRWQRLTAWHHFVPVLAASALLMWSLVLLAQVLILIFRYQVIVPLWDQWSEVTPAQELTHFFRRHNEHVIAIPRVIFILDQLLAKGKNTLSMAAIFVVQALHCVVLAVLYVVSQGRSRVTESTVAITAFLLASFFSLAQWENLVSGFQIGFVGVYFLATLAFGVIALRRPGWGTDVVAGLIGAAACLTMANGALVPLFILALALILRLPRLTILRLAFAGAIGWAIFAWAQLHPPTSGEPSSLLGKAGAFHVWPAMLALTGMLGRIFVAPDRWVVVWIGTCGITIVALLFTKRLFDQFFAAERGKPATAEKRARSALFAVTCFSLASTAAIAGGRLSFGAQALTTRYATPAIVFWSSLLLLVISSIPKRLRTGVAIVVAIGGCLSAAEWLNDASWIVWDRAAYFAPLETAMLADVPDWLEFMQTGLPLKVQPTVIRQVPELRKAELSVFADRWAKWLGKPLPSHLLVRDGECLGALEGVVEIAPGAWRLTGWSSVGSGLLVLDGRGLVVGYAKPSTLRLTAGHVPGDYGWVGHARVSPGEAISIIALFRDGRDACRLATAILREKIGKEVLAPSEFGPVRVLLEGGWIKGSGGVEGQPSAPAGDFFESRHGSDVNVGRLSMLLHLSPDDRQLQLPYTTGYYSRDIGLRLRLADTGTTIAEWQFPPIRDKWAIFELPIPDETLHAQPAERVAVFLDVVDYGSGPGQWAAVGLPRKSLKN